jgi:hypothetical protein
MRSSTRSIEPKWKTLYQAAMLELDTGALPHRVEGAKAAIHGRMAELEQAQEAPQRHSSRTRSICLMSCLGCTARRSERVLVIRKCAKHGKRHLYLLRVLRCRVFIVVRLQCLRTARKLVTESLVAGMAPMCQLRKISPIASERLGGPVMAR